MYYVVREQKIIRITTLIIQTKIFTNLKILIDNSLKRKQRRLINENYLLSVVAILENTIINYLVKKLKLNSISTILIMFSLEDLIDKVVVSQTF